MWGNSMYGVLKNWYKDLNISESEKLVMKHALGVGVLATTQLLIEFIYFAAINNQSQYFVKA